MPRIDSAGLTDSQTLQLPASEFDFVGPLSTILSPSQADASTTIGATKARRLVRGWGVDSSPVKYTSTACRTLQEGAVAIESLGKSDATMITLTVPGSTLSALVTVC